MNKIAGITLVVGSLAFVAVFSYLAAAFGYPEVLDRSAAEVLPALLQGGQRMRIVWFIYGALPVTFVFAGAVTRNAAPIVAGIAMMLGLLRWPTIEWTLAQHWNTGANPALAAMFDASNIFLGNLIGEFVGEMATAAWFLTLALAWRQRLLRTLGFVATALMFLAALRNITPAVAPIAALNNIALPLWLITIGVVLFRMPSARPPAAR